LKFHANALTIRHQNQHITKCVDRDQPINVVVKAQKAHSDLWDGFDRSQAGQ